MAVLPTQSFSTIVSNVVAGIQGRAGKLLNFSIGSTLRAIVEGFAGLFLWLQAMVLQVLTASRLSTAVGVDVDTFTADFMPTIGTSNGVASPRLGAQASTGQVTYGRFTAAPTSCFIPVGSTIQTGDGTQNFTVTADPTNTAYGSITNAAGALVYGYTMPAAVATLTVPVQNNVAGSVGNVGVGAISVMTSNVTGVDYVQNAAAFTNGIDQESDAQLKARFALYIQSLRSATEASIGYAVASIRVGMQWQIWENIDPNGGTDYGAYTIYVDDGSGAIPSTTLTAAQTSVFAVTAAGVRAQVLAATSAPANVVMTIVTAPGYNHNNAVAAVVAALTSYINGIGLGQVQNGALASGTLSYMKLGSIAFTVPGVTDVLSYTLNGSVNDFVPVRGAVIKSGSIVVS